MRQAYSILKRGDEAEYLIEAAVFRKDVCAGFDHKIVAKGGIFIPKGRASVASDQVRKNGGRGVTRGS